VSPQRPGHTGIQQKDKQEKKNLSAAPLLWRIWPCTNSSAKRMLEGQCLEIVHKLQTLERVYSLSITAAIKFNKRTIYNRKKAPSINVIKREDGTTIPRWKYYTSIYTCSA